MGLPESERAPISFPSWKAVLASAELPGAQKAEFIREIVTFLRFCKSRHTPVSVMRAKLYLEDVERQGPSRAREALRWFVRMGRRPARSEKSRSGEPVDGAAPVPTVRKKIDGATDGGLVPDGPRPSATPGSREASSGAVAGRHDRHQPALTQFAHRPAHALRSTRWGGLSRVAIGPPGALPIIAASRQAAERM
jgi:hypothetical protein